MTPPDQLQTKLMRAEFERGFRAGQAAERDDDGMGALTVAVLLLLGAAAGAWVSAIVMAS